MARKSINVDQLAESFLTTGSAEVERSRQPLPRKETADPQPSAAGRPRAFHEDTVLLQLRLPKALVTRIKMAALEEGKSESAIVAAWLNA